MVCQGTVRYQIWQDSFELFPGQALVINSNVPHSAFPVQNSQVVLSTVIIRPVFLYDAPGSDIEKSCFFKNLLLFNSK